MSEKKERNTGMGEWREGRGFVCYKAKGYNYLHEESSRKVSQWSIYMHFVIAYIQQSIYGFTQCTLTCTCIYIKAIYKTCKFSTHLLIYCTCTLMFLNCSEELPYT